MIHVVGGTYLEVCVDPAESELYGSGARAAATIADLSDGVEFSTYIDDRWADTLDSLAAAFQVRVNRHWVRHTSIFEYQHPLAAPVLDTGPAQMDAEPIAVNGSCILRFGMLEAEAVVHGERVVYDPQSELTPEPFTANGSTARELAIVANHEEGTTLTGRVDVGEVGRALMSEHGAEVAVIKRGPLGATVITASGEITVPAYRTRRVWPIGSGDVFSGVFAHFWGEKNSDPVDAARRASLATAYYCDTRVMPTPPSLFKRDLFRPIQWEEHRRRLPRAYLAAPFFDMGQRWIVEQARDALIGQRLEVFSPLHEVGLRPPAEGAPADLAAIRESAVVYAVLAGWDSGTVYEVAYARAHGVPVIAWVERLDAERLYMLEGDGCEIVEDFASSVYRAAWQAWSG